MAYIEKTTFDIFHSTTSENCFECDDVIAPVIRVLNLKGYKTKFCCSGHPFVVDNELIAFYQTPDEVKEVIDGVYEIEEITREEVDSKYSFDEIPFDSKIYRAKYVLTDCLGAYIAFEEGYLPSKLPEGWHMDDSCIRKFFEEEYNTEYDFFEKQLECMKNLKKWADELPQRNN